MELEERVKVLEDEVKLLKNEVQQTLLDIKEQLSEGTFSFSSLLKPKKTARGGTSQREKAEPIAEGEDDSSRGGLSRFL